MPSERSPKAIATEFHSVVDAYRVKRNQRAGHHQAFLAAINAYSLFHPDVSQTAAAHAVIENAGGLLVDLNGNPLCYNTRAEVLNPFFLACGADCSRWVNILRQIV